MVIYFVLGLIISFVFFSIVYEQRNDNKLYLKDKYKTIERAKFIECVNLPTFIFMICWASVFYGLFLLIMVYGAIEELVFRSTVNRLNNSKG